MKRPAAKAAATSTAAAAGEPKGKKAKSSETPEVKAKTPIALSPLAAKGNVVAAALEAADGCPPVVLQMLSGSVRKSLMVPKDQRHELQESMIKMMGEVLSSTEEKLLGICKEQKNKIIEVEAGHVLKEATLQSATMAVEARSAELEQARAGQGAAAEGLKAMVEAHAKSIKDKEAGDAAAGQVAYAKEGLERVVSDALNPLNDCTLSAGDHERMVKEVLQAGGTFGLNAALLQSAERALSVMAEERGGFDLLVVKQVEEEFAQKAEAMREELSSADARKAERAGKVEESQDKLTSAMEAVELSKKVFEAAEISLEAAKTARAAESTALELLGPAMQKVVAEARGADLQLKAFQDVLGPFRELADGSFWQSAETAAATPEAPEEPSGATAAELPPQTAAV